MRVYFRKVTPGGGESYEQLGAVIKNCLKKVVGKAKLSFEELNTVIVEIEKCVNSRPSTYLSEKHEDTVITPNHHGRDIDRKDTVQHKFNELSGDDMRKRQAYCQVTFKGATNLFLFLFFFFFFFFFILRGLSCILVFCVPVSLVSRFFVLCFGVNINLEDLKAHSKV